MAGRQRQLDLNLSTWGGRRTGAGRKPRDLKAGVSHQRRPELSKNTITHVTLRVHRAVASLRTKERVRALRKCLASAGTKSGFRVAHYSVQGSHMHLVVEADSRAALASGMNGLGTWMARRLNAIAGRRGRVFVDRYHARMLKTPREVRFVLAYVLLNWPRHLAQHGNRLRVPQPDPCSSGPLFDGWQESPTVAPTPEERACIVNPHGWMLRVGWRRYGCISLSEVPGSSI